MPDPGLLRFERLAQRGAFALTPETRYARSGSVNIAFQVIGEGPADLVFVPGYISNIEVKQIAAGVNMCMERRS